MITVIVGHRGTGKSKLLQRLQIYIGFENAEFVDLDTEIEKKLGRSIVELFNDHGEAYFREIEKQTFLECLQKPHTETFIVVGAGFDVAEIPIHVRVLWIKRKTDLDGRIFLDRPRLNPEISPVEEYRLRAQMREHRFWERADEIYLMPEGDFENQHQARLIEKKILMHQLNDVGGVFTILPEHQRAALTWTLFKARFVNRGIHYFEIRSDQFTLSEAITIMNEMPTEKFIFSFRGQVDLVELMENSVFHQVVDRSSFVDWAYELGVFDLVFKFFTKEKLILSLHQAEHFEIWSEYESRVAQMKYAPLINSFFELMVGEQWQLDNKTKRSFLPRSENARWDWYRLLKKGTQLINFWREGNGSAPDQPSLWAWSMTPPGAVSFAAVLGDPVHHSYSPLEQSEFFHKRNLPFFAIQVFRGEWDEAMASLRELGLSYAAVTSPHKSEAARYCRESGLKAVNTLYWNSQAQKWQGTSTDEQGFTDLIEGVGMVAPFQQEIFIWGGGGTLEVLQKSLPKAHYFSARTGELRSGDRSLLPPQPKIVIWAAPRSEETHFPPNEWAPKMVFDLNYKEDSMGKEYAQKCGAGYESGLVMFTAQARGQRMFWKKCEEPT